MNHAQIKAVLEGVIPEVKAAIAAAQKPLLERIAEIEAREPVKGEKGDPGEAIVGPPGEPGADGLDGKDGESVTINDVLPIIETEIAYLASTIPVPKDGKDGTNGTDGQKGLDGRPGELSLAPDDVADQIAKTIAMLAEAPTISPVIRNVTIPAAIPRPTSFEFERDENNNIIAAHGVDA